MKKHISTFFLIGTFIIGLSLLLYPTVSNYWNSLHQTRAIASYAENVGNLKNEEYERLWAGARQYNQRLSDQADRLLLTEQEKAEYESVLDVSGSGIMGYIEIPAIDCLLPIYHGTEEAVLQIAVGHIAGTSLPVGGAGTHCVLSGHRGLPSARLFTDLDQLVEGDRFVLRVLDEELTYEVDQILIVKPREADALQIMDGKDYCTLVTCTPYGINSHRLLVRGHRVENAAGSGSVRVTADAVQLEPELVAPIAAIPLLIVLLLVLLAQDRNRLKRKRYNNLLSGGGEDAKKS